MAVNRTPQQHVETEGSGIDDSLNPTLHDANAINLKDTLDYLASQVNDMVGSTNWYDAPALSLAAIDAKTFLDEKLALRRVDLLTDITIPATQNFKILSVAGSEVPAGKVKAIGVTTTKGLVTASHTGTFGTHALDEVAGGTTISPKNLLLVWDGTTGDELTSSGRRIYALLQNESTGTDGTAFTDTTPQRAQVSFVRPNATYDDLEACPVADIENKVVNLSFVERQDLDSWVEQDFLQNVTRVDLGAAGASVTLDNAIDNQGTTPATQQTDVFWRIDDSDGLYFQNSVGDRSLIAILPAAAGDEVEVNVDTLDVNVGAAGTIDFDNGMTVDSGGQSINVGTTAGQIDSTTLKLAASTGLAELEGVGVTIDALAGAGGPVTADGTILDADFSDDSHLIMAASDAAKKTLQIAARNGGAGAGELYLEADNDIVFETAQETTGIPLDDATAGAISGLFGQSFASVSAAIKYAGEQGGVDLTTKRFIMPSNYAQGVNVPAATLDLTAYDMDLAGGTPDLFLYLNGRLLDGADQVGQGDVYPGTTPANGDLKFDFPTGVKTGWVLVSIGLQE